MYPITYAGRFLRSLRPSGPPAGDDDQLLASYVKRGERACFEALVARHGPLVLGVCERVLVDSNDAEDAFQATFLVLVRKADQLRAGAPLGHWLYRVAYRVALKAKFRKLRQYSREAPAVDAVAPSAESTPWSDVKPLLDEELHRLPKPYRSLIVMCYLEGKSHQEAARALGWPSGSVSYRMIRARTILRDRLRRRGVALPALAFFAFLGEMAPASNVRPELVAATMESVKGQRPLAGWSCSKSTHGGSAGKAETMLTSPWTSSITTAVIVPLAVIGVAAIITALANLQVRQPHAGGAAAGNTSAATDSTAKLPEARESH